ncbi:MAG: hypothetical protein LBK76_03525 [Verrucomicrobiales bacterium]|jgi:16S rRNA G966 N2-methylase RsmD|nr:hypothetical protein [Verrucomicrobiales bacterium]
METKTDERTAVIEVRRLALADIKPHPKNPRKHPEENSAAWLVLKKSLERDYFDPLVVNRRNGMLVSGHLRHKILLASGFTHADVSLVDYDEATHVARLIAANSLIGEFDDATLTALAAELNAASLSASLAGWTEDELAALVDGLPPAADGEEKPVRDLKEKFGVAPFSILRVFQWLGRKKLWNTLIGDGGETRAGCLPKEGQFQMALPAVSLLDPVLCELMLLWFGMPHGVKPRCLDPFAGGAAFGFVSAFKGCEFTGVELRQEQCDLNGQRLAAAGLSGRYICDDGCNVLRHVAPESQDFLFSCPPYYNLEKYSNLPNDASNAPTFEEFIVVLDKALGDAALTLKENRFAVVVVSNVRDKKTGGYHDLAGAVVKIFQRRGLLFYNDLILADCLSSASRRAYQYMSNSRKVARVHQNVLVFYKGDVKKIAELFPVADIEETLTACVPENETWLGTGELHA